MSLKGRVDIITLLLEGELDENKIETIHNGIDINGQLDDHADSRNKEKSGRKDGTAASMLKT